MCFPEFYELIKKITKGEEELMRSLDLTVWSKVPVAWDLRLAAQVDSLVGLSPLI